MYIHEAEQMLKELAEEKEVDERIKQTLDKECLFNFGSEEGKRMRVLCDYYLKDFADKGLTIREVEKLADILAMEVYRAVLRQKYKETFTFLE